MNNKRLKINYILGIDTSCDETSVAVCYQNFVISNVISSQVELHRKYGGVVPMIAKREHESNFDYVLEEALKRAGKVLKLKFTMDKIDAIAVTYGPGLAIALEVGIKKAKKLAVKYKKPIIAVNHMEGHLLSPLAGNSKHRINIDWEKMSFPVMGLLISGGHTEIILVESIGKYQVLGETLDDAIGEAYDKAARILGFGYPGGAVLTEMAKKGDKLKYSLPIPLKNDKSLNFSFSGLKTALYYQIQEKGGFENLTKKQALDYSAGFENSAIQHLQNKLTLAFEKYPVKILLVGGGVSASAAVRKGIYCIAKRFNIKTYFPFARNLYTDNAGMIAVAGYFKAARNEFNNMNLDRMPRADL